MAREVYGLNSEDFARLKEALESSRFSCKYFIERVSPREGMTHDIFTAYHVENASVQLSPFDNLGRHKPRLIVIAKEDETVRQAKSALEDIGGTPEKKMELIKI